MCVTLQNVTDAGQLSDAISLAERISEYFINGSLSIHPDRDGIAGMRRSLISPGVATASGHLNLSHQDIQTGVAASCSIYVDLNWRNQSPTLRCGEKWIRGREHENTRPSWHINSDDTFCYVINLEWSDCLKAIQEQHGDDIMTAAAAFYCVNNVRWLLYRHLEGYRRKLQVWDPLWPEWPHYGAGLREYANKKRLNLHLPR